MNEAGHEVVYTDNILNNEETIVNCCDILDQEKSSNTNVNHEKSSSAVWTTDLVLTLLKLYENKLEMLEHPKKKTRIWVAISESLKEYNIEMSPDQVRWKINALTKRYKQSLDSGQHNKFKYFKEMNNIFAQYKLISDTYYSISDVVQKKNNEQRNQNQSRECGRESKTIIEFRKRRLAKKIEADRCQSKVKLEKQWLEYLKRQEEHRQIKDDIFARNLKLREQELELRRRELQAKEALELRRLQLKEKEQEEMIKLETEKCELLKKIFSQRIY